MRIGSMSILYFSHLLPLASLSHYLSMYLTSPSLKTPSVIAMESVEPEVPDIEMSDVTKGAILKTDQADAEMKIEQC